MKMKFVKGDPRINRNGRPKGKPNAGLKAEIETFVCDVFPTLKQEFQALDTHQKFAVFEKLTSYILPKPKEIDLSMQVERLTDEQLSQLADHILNDYNKTA